MRCTLRQPELSTRHLRCRTRGLDGGAIALHPAQEQLRGSGILVDVTTDSAEDAEAAEDRRMVRAAHQDLGAPEDLHHRLQAKADQVLR